MKIKIVVLLVLAVLYGVYQARFKGRGSVRLYRISDTASFALRPGAEEDSSITIQGTQPTSRLVGALCGEWQADYSRVDMAQAKFVRGDWVYSPYPQHASAKADIFNLRTGESINMDVPGNPTFVVDLATLPAYRERGLISDPQYKLTANFVRAQFKPLSTCGSPCLSVHSGFGLAVLFTFCPHLLIGLIDLFVRAHSPRSELGEGIGDTVQ